MYGTQARTELKSAWFMFENDVKMYGTQAGGKKMITRTLFENDVKMYGTQAKTFLFYCILFV